MTKQTDIIALGALGFLDPAVTHLDTLRDAAYGDRIGRIGSCTLRRLHQTLREVRQGRLIEQVGAGFGGRLGGRCS